MENDENLSDYDKKRIAEIKERAKIEKEIADKLKTDDCLAKYFEQFSPYSVERFIDSYKSKKTLLLKHGKNWAITEEKERFEWINKANKHLAFIQQKKLFDMQCKWRAGQIDIEGIDICYDFEIWQYDVLNCPFIEPISMNDIDLYIAFLNSDYHDYKERKWRNTNWQDYDDIKLGYESNNREGSEIEWYEYYNVYKGISVLMTLPNIKGMKEEHYMQVAREDEKKESEKKIPSTETTINEPAKPAIGDTYDEKFMKWFIGNFENAELAKYYDLYRRYRFDDDLDSINNLVYKFFHAGEPIAIEANNDWKEALFIAEKKYKIRKTVEHLPIAYETYLLNNSLNIKNESLDEDYGHYLIIKNIYVERILKGRELCGEPRNFDY